MQTKPTSQHTRTERSQSEHWYARRPVAVQSELKAISSLLTSGRPVSTIAAQGVQGYHTNTYHNALLLQHQSPCYSLRQAPLLLAPIYAALALGLTVTSLDHHQVNSNGRHVRRIDWPVAEAPSQVPHLRRGLTHRAAGD
jgi:hypothetical protein